MNSHNEHQDHDGRCELCSSSVPCAACDPKLSAVRSSAFFEENEKLGPQGADSTAGGREVDLGKPAARFGKPGEPIRFGSLGKVVLGVPRYCKRIIDLPVGAKIRLRLREQSIAEVFVRTANGLQRYFIEDAGEFWKLGQLSAENRTLQSE